MRSSTAIAQALRRILARSRTLEMFRGDRLLLWAYIAAAVLVTVPMWWTPFLPLIDMGSNVGASGLLNDALLSRPVIGAHFYVNWFPVPYWSGYALMAMVDTIAGPFAAQYAIVAVDLWLMPLAAMRLMLALGRNPRLGLWVFLLAWDTNLYWGWVSFQLGMAIALYGLARLTEVSSYRDAVKLLPLSMLVALSHAHGVVLLGLGGVLMALAHREPWQQFKRVVVALAGTGLMGLPWLLTRFSASAIESRGFTYNSPGMPDRINKFFSYTLDNIPGMFGETVTGLALLILVLGPLLLTLLPGPVPEDGASPPEPQSFRRGLLPLALLAATVFPYLVLPFAFYKPVEHWWNHPRFATYILIAALTVPRPDLFGRRALALLPGAAVFAALMGAMSLQFHGYGARTRPYLDIIAALPHGSRFFPLDLEKDWEGTRYASLGQLHGFAAAATGSYDPHLFDEGNNPLQFRRDRLLPVPNWRKLHTFSMDAYGQYYDHIIVHPRDRDPLAGQPGLTRVKDAGTWRLYRVDDPQPPPPPSRARK